MPNLFSKLFESVVEWFKKHVIVEVRKTRTTETAQELFERKLLTREEYAEFYGHELTTYEKRISRYLEKHPKAALAEARGHPPQRTLTPQRTRRRKR